MLLDSFQPTIVSREEPQYSATLTGSVCAQCKLCMTFICNFGAVSKIYVTSG